MITNHKIRDKKLQMILTKKLQKYQHYHQLKLINMNNIGEQATFTYSPL